MADELLSPGEAAAFLGISRQRLTQLRENKQVAAQRVGRFWLYPRLDLERRKAEQAQRNKHEGRLKVDAEVTSPV